MSQRLLNRGSVQHGGEDLCTVAVTRQMSCEGDGKGAVLQVVHNSIGERGGVSS